MNCTYDYQENFTICLTRVLVNNLIDKTNEIKDNMVYNPTQSNLVNEERSL